MSAEDKYSQFPICGLAYGPDIKTRVSHLLSYSFIEAGREMLRKIGAGLSNPEQAEMWKERAEQCDTPEDCDSDLWPHCAAVIGAESLGISIHSVEASVKHFEAVGNFIRLHEIQHGTDPLVRVPKNLLFEVRDGGGISYREFSVLCAVNSIIGAKKFPVAVRRDLVKVRALGYKSPAVAKALRGRRKDGLKEMTDWQVRATLEKLHMLGFFARAHDAHARRATYYSNKMNDAELRAAVLKSQSYRQSFRDKQRDMDGKLGEALKAKRAELHRETTTIIVKEQAPETTTTSHHVASTEPPPNHHGHHHLNINSIIETPLNRNSENTNPSNTAGACGWCGSREGWIKPRVSLDQPICKECETTHFN
jgi:hypothetical protein